LVISVHVGLPSGRVPIYLIKLSIRQNRKMLVVVHALVVMENRRLQ
jgi:hypothetical protein